MVHNNSHRAARWGAYQRESISCILIIICIASLEKASSILKRHQNHGNICVERYVKVERGGEHRVGG